MSEATAGYYDIHNHILPGVDDGAQNEKQSMEMLKIAREAGTSHLVLTPHYIPGANPYKPEELTERFAALKELAAKECPELTFFLGNEILYRDGIVALLQNGEIHTMNDTRYVLVEFNIQIPYKELSRAMRELTDARYRPVIAHVERYHCLAGRMDRIFELEESGIYLQMNAESIPGKTFDERGRFCRKLLKEECITFLGSDAHNTQGRHPSMKKAVEWMEKHLDAEYVDRVLKEYPAQMLQNKYIR